MRHVPVLLTEVIESLQLKPGMRVVDCTLGDAGHSEAMLEAIGLKGRLLGIDADPESLLRAKQYLYRFGEQVIFARDNFAELKRILDEHTFVPVDAILMDLGWSSPQFAERGRGFSFEKDEPLDMRYGGTSQITISNFQTKLHDQALNPNEELTAATVVNTYDFDELYRVLHRYGEEPLSREIADAIIDARKVKPIERTSELVEIILQEYRKKLKTNKDVPWIGGNHPATKVFQALRIEVNKELDVLREALPQAVEALAAGGRLAVLTFHSLEDRIVKQFFQTVAGKKVRLVNKKPIVASEVEARENPRSRSAKLRVVEKL